jgi:hypothetical protein
MLDLSGYRADWEGKLVWYEEHGIRPWDQGGGPSGSLVWSAEKQGAPGINAHEIEQLASRCSARTHRGAAPSSARAGQPPRPTVRAGRTSRTAWSSCIEAVVLQESCLCHRE